MSDTHDMRFSIAQPALLLMEFVLLVQKNFGELCPDDVTVDQWHATDDPSFADEVARELELTQDKPAAAEEQPSVVPTPNVRRFRSRRRLRMEDVE